MTRLVPHDAHQPLVVATLDFVHEAALEPHQARMREVEGNRDAWHTVRREPLFRQPEMRSEANTLCGELGVQATHARFERRTREPEAQIAEALAEQRFVVEPGPRRLARGQSTGPRPPPPRPTGHELRAATATAANVRARRSRMRVRHWSSKSRRRKLSSIAAGIPLSPCTPPASAPARAPQIAGSCVPWTAVLTARSK